MARLLMAALTEAGSEVNLVSTLRSYRRQPDLDALRVEAAGERERICSLFRAGRTPDAWFTYHPYYKAPDLLGPQISHMFGIPYFTAEASYSSRRQKSEWGNTQQQVIDAVQMADANFCMTAIDREGLSRIAPADRLVTLPAFIDTTPYRRHDPTVSRRPPARLVTVAMMRKGVKFDSYSLLAKSLQQIAHKAWTLEIIGDGRARADVEALFAGLGGERIVWRGELAPDQIRTALGQSDIFVWPGFGEAYGLAYLEAQASGLPVVAQDTAGVPSVVQHGRTGLLTPPGDACAYADAVLRLIEDDALRSRLADGAYSFVHEERNLGSASAALAAHLNRVVSERQQTMAK